MVSCVPAHVHPSYRADLTDAQWELIAPMVPPLPGGRPPKHARRRIVDAIQYVNRTGCAWRQLPHDFPPWQTVYWYFRMWNDAGMTDRIHDALRAAVRDRDGRDPMASAGIVDAQSIKGADTVGRNSRGYDAGKKTNGRKRHIVVRSPSGPGVGINHLGLVALCPSGSSARKHGDGNDLPGAKKLPMLPCACPR